MSMILSPVQRSRVNAIVEARDTPALIPEIALMICQFAFPHPYSLKGRVKLASFSISKCQELVPIAKDRLLTNYFGADVRLWDFSTLPPVCLTSFEKFDPKDKWAATPVNIGNNCIASGDIDGKIAIWNLSFPYRVEWSISAHFESITSLAFFSKKNYLISVSYDKHIHIWDVCKKILVKTFNQPCIHHTEPIDEVRILTKERFVTSARDGKLNIWDIDADPENALISTFRKNTKWCHQKITVLSNGNIACENPASHPHKDRNKKIISIFDPSKPSHKNPIDTFFSKNKNRVTHFTELKTLQDGTLASSYFVENVIHIVDLEKDKKKASLTLKLEDSDIYGFGFAQLGNGHLVVNGGNGKLTVFE